MVCEWMTALKRYSSIDIATHMAYLMKDYDVFEQVSIANSQIQLFAQGTKKKYP